MGCGCTDRAHIIGEGDESLGEDRFWSAVIIAGGLTAVLLTKGGKVTKGTRDLLLVGVGGALLAVIAKKVIEPRFG